jgi:hypothetical protein
MCNSTIAAHWACTASHSVATTISIHVNEWASEALWLGRTTLSWVSLIWLWRTAKHVQHRPRRCLVAHKAGGRTHHGWHIGIACVLALRWHPSLRRRGRSLCCTLWWRCHVESWRHVRPWARHTRRHTRLTMLHRRWRLCRPARRRHTRRHLVKTWGTTKSWRRSMNGRLLLLPTGAFARIMHLFIIRRASAFRPLSVEIVEA